MPKPVEMFGLAIPGRRVDLYAIKQKTLLQRLEKFLGRVAIYGLVLALGAILTLIIQSL